MLRLVTFGGLALSSDGDDKPQRRRRLALLARLAAAGDQGVSREELLAMFRADSDGEGARDSLDQLLSDARRSFDASPTVGTTTLCLDPTVITSDLSDWSTAIATEDYEAAVDLYHGPFLHGFVLQGAPEFDRWVESARAQYASEYRKALESLATKASADRRYAESVEWWRRLASDDRFGSHTALGLMRALADAGDRAGALEFARVHERIVSAELESAPDPAILSYAEELRTATAQRVAPTPTSSPALGDEKAGRADARPRSARAHRSPYDRSGSRKGQIAAAAAALSLMAVLYASRSPDKPAQRNETATISAHELYVRGSDSRLLRSDSGQLVAIDLLERAVAADSTYIPAYTMLARQYATAAWGRPSATKSQRAGLLENAVSTATRAVSLDTGSADVHDALSYVLSVNQKPGDGVAEAERAVRIDSSVAAYHQSLARAYQWVGRFKEALAEAQKAALLDQRSVAASADLGEALYFTGRYDEALKQLDKVAGIESPSSRKPLYYGEAYAAMSKWREALDAMAAHTQTDPHVLGLTGYVLARSGAKDSALSVLRTLESSPSARAFPIAVVFAGLKNFDSAFVWIDRSFEDYSLHPMIMGPLFDDLHKRPEFANVRQRLRLPLE
jgi:DNA-binding SARP family transcriptional activator